MNITDLQLARTGQHPCSYLAEQQESLIFTLPEQPLTAELYQQLMQLNFRRTGEQLYRPYCRNCQACQAVKIDPSQFSPSRSQRKLWRKALKLDWHYRINRQPDCEAYYELYLHYIREKHADGSMYPPSPDQLDAMFACDWLPIVTLEQYLDGRLVGVLLLDEVLQSWSAVYSFYDPTVPLALGRVAILAALAAAKAQQQQYLYLGYYISDCQKMAYKADFLPQQRLIQHNWQSFD